MSDEIASNELKKPKLFISYSWTSSAHVDWVLQLATDLRRHGVDAIIDQWHLKEGQDAHAFMEQMIRKDEIEKVILICDEKYIDRANLREGGVGIESQIITNSIYGDIEQTKFVPVALASDDEGQALLPNFLTSRIYIDFRDSDMYAENLIKLMRWAFDMPLHALPELGERPKFLEDQIKFQSITLNRNHGKISGNSENSRSLIAILREAREKYCDFTLDLSGQSDGDQKVVDSIEALPPLISQILVSVRDECEKNELGDIALDSIVQFFEKLLSNFRKGNTNWGADVTKFFAEFMYVAIVALMLRTRRFSTLGKFLRTPILTMEDGSVTARTVSVSRLNTSVSSLEYRNKNLKLNRASLHADFIKDVCEKVPIDFWEYLQSDFYLFLFFELQEIEGRWWPDSNIYATDRDGSFPLFARATQVEIRENLLKPLGLNEKSALEKLKNDISEGRYNNIRWSSSFSRLQIWSLGNFEEILKSYN